MANLIKVKRGTLTQLNTAGTNNLLIEGEPYLITDEGRLAIGLTSATYAAFAKTSEIQPLDGDLTAIAALSGTTGLLRKTAANTYTLDTAAYLTGNQTITVSGDATGSGTTTLALTLKNTGTAGTYTKVTTDAQGRVSSGTTLSASDIPSLTAAKITDFDTQVRTTTVAQLAAPVAALDMNSQKITGLADPTLAQDAATKAYVDGVAQGLDIKPSVRLATAASISSLSGAQTIDGTAVVTGNRILVKDHTTASQNGIWIANTGGAWTRATDADVWTELISAFTFVEEGTTNADTSWVSTVNAGGALDTTAITFVQFGAAGTVTAGTGLTSNGNTINVIGTANRIIANADSIDIDSAYVGQTSITTLGTIATGTWSATEIGVTKGGTGLTAAVTGLLKGNGTAYSAATAGTDYLAPDSTIDGGTF